MLAVVAGLRRKTKKFAMLDVLAHHFGSFVSTERILHAVYGDHEDGGPLTAPVAVRAMAHELRQQIRPYGLAIEGQSYSGYRLLWSVPVGNGRDWMVP